MSYIGIQLDGDTDFLDTQEDTSIEITINNPLLGNADSLSPGSYSFPFNLPGGIKSPKNAAKLKHPDVIENNEAYQIQKAKLFAGDVPYKTGTLKSSSSGDKNVVTANFLFGLNSINPALKTARLRDVMNEQVVIDTSDIAKKIYFKKITGGDLTVTINGKSYTAANIFDLSLIINDDGLASEDTGVFVARAVAHNAGSSPGGMAANYIELKATRYYTLAGVHLQEDSVDPFVPLSITVDDAEVGNYVFESFNMNAYYAAFSTFMADYLSGAFPSNKYRFPVMFNASLYESDQPCFKQYGELINGVNGGGLILNDWQNNKNYNTVQPFVLLKYVFDKIATTFGFELEGDFYTDSEVANILLFNSHTLDVPMDYIGKNKYVFWKRDFNVSDMVPDVTVPEFLIAMASRYNLGIYPNEETQKVRLKYLNNVAKANAYDDITVDASPIGNIEDQRVTGFTLNCPKDDSDKFSLPETLIIGTSQETIDIGCRRLFQTNFLSIGGVMTGPRVSVKNNEPKFGLTIFHFKHIVNNGSFRYQAADIHGADFYEGLDDNGIIPGIYSRYYKYWLTFKKNWRLITLKVNWPLRKLLRFDYELKRRFDRNNYIVANMKVKITNKSVQATEVQLLTMK